MNTSSPDKKTKSESNLLKSKGIANASKKMLNKDADPFGNTDMNNASLPNEKKGRLSMKATSMKEITMPRNVNFYRHIINRNDATEFDVNWVLKLRGPEEDTNRLARIPNQPFSFFGKSTESLMQRKKVVDVQANQSKLSDMQHLIRHRLGATPCMAQLAFESGLRDYKDNEALREKERGFTNLPKKDRQEFPQLYPSYQEMDKIKNWTTKNTSIKTHTAFDGYIKLPEYKEFEKQEPRNVQDTRHLQYPGKLISTLAWELSMR